MIAGALSGGHWYTSLWPWPLVSLYVGHFLISGLAMVNPGKPTIRRVLSFAIGFLLFVGAGYLAPFRPADVDIRYVGFCLCAVLVCVSLFAIFERRWVDRIVGVLGILLVAGTLYLDNYDIVESFFQHRFGRWL